MNYEELFLEMLKCERCFSRKEKLLLPGTGNINADVMFIGEAPSIHRKFNLTFGMKSRPIIDAVLKKLDLTRDEVWMSNVVKCIIPEKCTGDPSKCRSFLLKEIEIVNPSKIYLFGRTAINAILQKKVRFGTVVRTLDREIYCMPHPMTVVRGMYMLEKYLDLLWGLQK